MNRGGCSDHPTIVGRDLGRVQDRVVTSIGSVACDPGGVMSPATVFAARAGVVQAESKLLQRDGPLLRLTWNFHISKVIT
jgi:hypothetical protein